MRFAKIIFSFSTALFLSSTALAQSGDWRAVKNLLPGTRISVRSEHRSHTLCIFERATDDQLFCARILRSVSRVLVPPDAVYARKEIREVRIEHSDHANAAVGALIGGGVGATLGAENSNGAMTRGGRALLLGTGGALVGGVFGRDFPIFHGKVIYRQ